MCRYASLHCFTPFQILFQPIPLNRQHSIESMARKQYRSEIGIVCDILDVTIEAGRDGACVSAITQKANVSHCAARAKCGKLVDAGLVRYDKGYRNHVFTITEKGLGFANELRKFMDLADSLKLRY